MTRLYQTLVAVLLCCVVAAPAHAEAEPPWVPLSVVMSELSADPAFVDAVLRRLGRDPDDGGILGPDQIRRLRELILGKQWQALDRFPGLTVIGLGRTVRLAAATRQYAADRDAAPPPEDAHSKESATDSDVVEPLGIPRDNPPLEPDSYIRSLGFGLQIGDRVDPERAASHGDALRLAEGLNRLALNPAAGEDGPHYQLSFQGAIANSASELLVLLYKAGHEVEVRDARYFANFGDLIYHGHDVLTPFWLDTGIVIPGTDRSLLVPVSHSQHELRVRGPEVNADLSFYFGIDGRAEFRPIDTRDQAWVLGRIAHTYRNDAALEVVRMAGAIIKTYDAIKREHPELAFGGYYVLGVCNDVNAMIELHMQGETTLFPLTLDTGYFLGEGEVDRLARRLPIDGRGRPRPEVARVLGSLPVENPSELPLPELRRDLELVKAAWLRGELEHTGSWPAWAWMAAGAGVMVTMYILASRWRGHNRRSP